MAVKGSYTRVERSLAKAAVVRYGPAAAARLLAELWGSAPNQNTLTAWMRNDAIPVTELARRQWSAYDETIGAAARTRLVGTFDRAVSALEYQLDTPGDIKRMQLAQPLAIAVGIIYDKLAPPASKAPAGIDIGGTGNSVIINVIAPPATDPARTARPIVLEQVAS